MRANGRSRALSEVRLCDIAHHEAQGARLDFTHGLRKSSLGSLPMLMRFCKTGLPGYREAGGGTAAVLGIGENLDQARTLERPQILTERRSIHHEDGCEIADISGSACAQKPHYDILSRPERNGCQALVIEPRHMARCPADGGGVAPHDAGAPVDRSFRHVEAVPRNQTLRSERIALRSIAVIEREALGCDLLIRSKGRRGFQGSPDRTFAANSYARSAARRQIIAGLLVQRSFQIGCQA